VAAVGTATATVFTPPAGGGESNPASFVINQPQNPVPQITSISPVAALTGGPAFVLTVNGTGFSPNSVAQVNGENRTTSFVNVNQLAVQILASDLDSAGSLAIRVFSPPPGGGTSGELILLVLNPFPTITSISPNVVADRSPAFTLTVTGSDFVPGAQILIKGTARITTFVN